MSQNNLFWPLTIVVVFGLAMTLTWANGVAAPLAQDGCGSPGDAQYEACQQTATANIANQQATGNAQRGTTSPDSTATTENESDDATRTPTRTADSSSDDETSTPDGDETDTPTSTIEASSTPAGTPTEPLASATATEIPTPDPSTIQCLPGEPFEIKGEGPPSTALIAYFNERPVGGTVSNSLGAYLITLTIGEERDGTYEIEVQTRDSRAVVDTFTCTVPMFTPTPTPLVPRPQTTP